MANSDIQGQVTDASGNPVSNAVVALWKQNSPNQVITTQADTNGNYIFNGHPDGDGTSTDWHLTARDPNDGTRQFPSLHSVSAQLDRGIPNSGVSRWTLDDSDTVAGGTQDIWGNNDANLNGVTTGVSGANKTYDTGQAHSYDGTDDDAITQSAGVTSFPFTLAVWCKTGGDASLISIHGGNQSFTHIRITNGLFKWANYSGSFNDYGGNTTVSDGTWHHLIAAVSSSDVVGYVDGGEDWSATHGEPFPSVSEILFGITRTSDDVDRLTGDLDDARLYNKQISSTEASDLYNTGSI